VRTPTEILTRPEKLTGSEFEIMKRHTVDAPGSSRTTEVPPLAPVVAFEHHRRLDAPGIPTASRATG